MTIKKTLNLIVLPILLVLSASLVIAGTLLPRHELYYPALLFLMASGVLELLDISLNWRSRKGFVLSMFNLVLLVLFALNYIFERFPVIAAQDWHLGIAIITFYVIDIGIYALFLRSQCAADKRLLTGLLAFAIPPLMAAAMFYLGVKAWIGLSLITLTLVLSSVFQPGIRIDTKKPD